MKLTATCLIFGIAALSSAQVFTRPSTSGTGVSDTGISLSLAAGDSFSGSATYKLQGLGTGFNRYDVRMVSSRSVGSFSTTFPANPVATTNVPGFARTLNGTGAAASASNTDYYTAQNDSTFALSASVSRIGETSATALASISIAASQAPIATGTVVGSVGSAGSPVVTQLSTPSLWVFDFPGNPATGTATINLSNTSANFSRALNAYGVASGHRDNVRMEVSVFLDGVQFGATRVSAVNTALAAGVGAGSQNSTFSGLSPVTLNVADIYGQTKTLSVTTKLIGTAYFGNTTSLGDYTIAQSTWSGVSVQGVPEPASIAGLSLGLLAFARRRKSK